jgi:hypothetical protein
MKNVKFSKAKNSYISVVTSKYMNTFCFIFFGTIILKVVKFIDFFVKLNYLFVYCC